ncbi:hypothetical protein BLOT_004116 [Blomia tropicalis]|nr:hypothetical protein BLOT_004116 [Blomia tropicalis]
MASFSSSGLSQLAHIKYLQQSSELSGLTKTNEASAFVRKNNLSLRSIAKIVPRGKSAQFNGI